MKSALKPILLIVNLFFSAYQSSAVFGLGNYYNKLHSKPDGTAGGDFPADAGASAFNKVRPGLQPGITIIAEEVISSSFFDITLTFPSPQF